jgi:AcrR family transcriptional regulator/DNA-binding MarR family transcriptional regulator
VAEIQRARILSAAVEVITERGAGEATVGRVVTRAGLSRRTFYELFEDREDCFLAAFEHAVARAAAVVVPAYRGQDTWRERVRVGLAALLGFLDEEPELGALMVVDALGGGPGALRRRTGVLDSLIEAVDEGRAGARVGEELQPLTAEGVVGAVFSVIHARVLERGSGVVTGSARPAQAARRKSSPPLTELVNLLMSMIVMPYLGAAAARRELHRPAVKYRSAPRPRRDPLRDLDMRLTYRTVRVLMAIAANAGASNRQVAGHAGVQDQGQMSKLLARLEHLGLVENTGRGQARGEANAWMLTPKGREVERAIRTQGSQEDHRVEPDG